MGYPDNVLAGDEQVVLHRHPHWKRDRPRADLLLATARWPRSPAAWVQTLGWESHAKMVVSLVLLAIWLVVIGWLTIWPFLTWWTTHFVITDRRVMFRHGLLTRTGIDIPLARINSVEFRHDWSTGCCAGTLIIESASRAWFYDIPRVEQVHALLYHEVFDTLDSEESPS